MTDTSTRKRDDAPLSRRNRDEASDVMGRRMAVNRNNLDFDNFEYRYINDVNNTRLYDLVTYREWEVVTQSGGGIIKTDATDLGNAVSIVVGSKPDGSAMRTYLCRKPKRFFDEDRAKKQKELDEQLAQLRRGNTKAGEPQGDYIPSSGIQIAGT